MSNKEKIDEIVRINVLLSKELRKKYKTFCINNNVIMSERIRQLIIKDLESKIE